LEPKLSRLTVVISPAADTADIEIQVDRVSVRRAAWGVPAPLDPGTHMVEARVSGRKAWSQQVFVGQQLANLTVTVPVLEPEAPQLPVPSESPLAAETVSKRPVPSSVYVAGAVTLGLVAGAVTTGVIYTARRSKFSATENDPEYEATRRWGLINLLLIGGAIV